MTGPKTIPCTVVCILFIVISELRGRDYIASLLRFYAVCSRAKYVVLLGNTVSPIIVRELAHSGGYRVLGLPGNLDDVSVVSALKEVGGLLEGRVLELGGYACGGIGVLVEQSIERIKNVDKLDILFTFYPGRDNSCEAGSGFKAIDDLVKRVNPSIVVVGKCRDPCIRGRVVCPGNGFRGYVALLKPGKTGFRASLDNLYRLLSAKTYADLGCS